MNVKVLDFEEVARCYKPYVESVTALEEKANKHREHLNSLQEEAQKILSAGSVIELDEAAKQTNSAKIQRLQQEAMLKDKEFKMEADSEQRRIIMDSYDGISALVNEYVESHPHVEVVLNRSEVVYYNPDCNLTDMIIDMVKEKDLYTDERLRDFKDETEEG